MYELINGRSMTLSRIVTEARLSIDSRYLLIIIKRVVNDVSCRHQWRVWQLRGS